MGAQASMSALDDDNNEEAMDEEKFEEDYGESGGMTEGLDQTSPQTLEDNGLINLEWPTQKDVPEPSVKIKKIALKRAREKVKRAKSMFMLFSIDAGARLEKGLSMKDRAPIIKEKYKEMLDNPTEKEKWTAKAQEDKNRYERELAEARARAGRFREGRPPRGKQRWGHLSAAWTEH